MRTGIEEPKPKSPPIARRGAGRRKPHPIKDGPSLAATVAAVTIAHATPPAMEKTTYGPSTQLTPCPNGTTVTSLV